VPLLEWVVLHRGIHYSRCSSLCSLILGGVHKLRTYHTTVLQGKVTDHLKALQPLSNCRALIELTGWAKLIYYLHASMPYYVRSPIQIYLTNKYPQCWSSSIIGLKTINNALLKIGSWSMSGNASGPCQEMHIF
jgi:hypothetical protein